LIELRKLILGIYNELPANGSWKFVNADNNLDVNNPWNYSETRAISDLANDMMAEDFVGVKIGDVNGSVVANANTTSTEVSRVGEVLVLDYNDRMVEEGEVVELTFATDRSDVYGYQFTMNTGALELMDVRGVDVSHVGVFKDKLTMSYNADKALSQGSLVTLVMKAQTTGQLSEMIDMGSEVTKAEAYVGDALDIVEIDLADSRDVASFVLYQNEPNPFTDYTLIKFELPDAGKATLTLYDVTGKILNVIQGNYEKGMNSIKLTREDIGASGMIYYQLQYAGDTQTEYMVNLK
jgi:hypothetical protein